MALTARLIILNYLFKSRVNRGFNADFICVAW